MSRIRRANDPSRRRARRNNRAFALLDIHSNHRCPSRARFGRARAFHKRAQTREKPSAFFLAISSRRRLLKCAGGVTHTHTHTPREKKNAFHRNYREARKNHPPRARRRSREEEKRTSFYSLSSDKFFVRGRRKKKRRREKNCVKKFRVPNPKKIMWTQQFRRKKCTTGKNNT